MSASNLIILNGSDKTRHYTVAIGSGAPSTTTEELVAQTSKYPKGSFYIDTATGTLYVRQAIAKAVVDWTSQKGAKGDPGNNGLFSAPLANCADFAALKAAMIAAGLMAAE